MLWALVTSMDLFHTKEYGKQKTNQTLQAPAAMTCPKALSLKGPSSTSSQHVL